MLAKLLLFCASGCLAALFFLRLEKLGARGWENACVAKSLYINAPDTQLFRNGTLVAAFYASFRHPKKPFFGQKGASGQSQGTHFAFYGALRKLSPEPPEHRYKTAVALLQGSRNIAPEALEKVYGQPGKPFFAFFNDKETPPSTETQHVTRSALRIFHFPRQRYKKENAHKVRLAKPLFVGP